MSEREDFGLKISTTMDLHSKRFQQQEQHLKHGRRSLRRRMCNFNLFKADGIFKIHSHVPYPIIRSTTRVCGRSYRE
jgi:hypothetical protein